jgi:chemotaxis protein CheZ
MPELNNELHEYLESMGADGFGQIPVADVGKIVDEILGSLDGDLTVEDIIRFNGGDKMAQPGADRTKTKNSDRPAVPPGAAELLQGEIFPDINNDLSSVGDRLQDAAQRILASTEKVEALMDSLKPEQAGVLLDAITEIYSACGFEDITGQTLGRVMGKLRQVEYESERLLAAMGNKEAEKRTEQLEKEIEIEMAREQEQLLHGPDSMKEANSQEEIDKILASFD